MDLSTSTISVPSDCDIDADRLLEVDTILKSHEAFKRKFLNFYLKNNLTFDCLVDAARLINSVPNSLFKVPEAKYKLMKQFSTEAVPFHLNVFCESCKGYYGGEAGDTMVCIRCNTKLKAKETNFFISINVSIQLNKIIQQNWNEIIEFQKLRNESAISDIMDSEIIKDLSQKNPYGLKLSLLVNTDGIQVSKSSKKSLWPIQLLCNFLPPKIRFHQRNVVIAGLCLDMKKVGMLSFFKPLGEEFNKISSEGIMMEIDGVKKLLYFHVTHCSVDLPAQSLVQGINLYSGYNACTICLHAGVPIEGAQNNAFYVRYIWRGVYEKRRCHDSTLLDMENFENGQVSIKSFKYSKWNV